MQQYTALGMLYTGLQTALLACVRYWLYQDNLRLSARRMYLISFALSMTATLAWIVTGGLPGMPFSLFRLLIAVTMFAVSCCVIREPLAKHTYTYSFIMIYDSVLELTASYVQYRCMPGARGYVFALTAAALVACTFLPAVRYLKSMITRLSAAGNDRLWGWLCVISFSFVFMNLLFTYPPAATLTLRELMSRYLMLFGVVGMYMATVRAVETMREAAEAKAALELTRRRVELQESYYARMTTQMDEVRRMRHDLRHHRAALAALMQSGDMEALASYIDAAAGDEAAVPITGNLTCDSVLLYYLDAAKALSAPIEMSLAIGRKTPVADPDLCVILGNLLENAVDAQRHVPVESRYIRITASASPTALTIAVDNRFDGTLLCAPNGAYLSRKEGGGHGLGLASVRTIAEKYGGVLQLEVEGDLFMAGVAIGV